MRDRFIIDETGHAHAVASLPGDVLPHLLDLERARPGRYEGDCTREAMILRLEIELIARRIDQAAG